MGEGSISSPTLFIDRCAWSGKLGAALEAANIPFVAHHQRFAPDAPDEDWLRAASSEGWLIVTRDQRIRYRPNELRAVMDAKLHMFVFSQGGLSAAETASILCATYPRMCSLAAQHRPPAFFSLTKSREVRQLKVSPPGR